jgi:hypothetical protein
MSKSEASAFSQFEDHWMNDTVKARPFTIDELRAYLVEIFPEFWKDGDFRVEDIAPMSATVRLIPKVIATDRRGPSPAFRWR